MLTLSANAPAKINWYLNVLSKRDNGYHDIQTVMQTIDLYDTVCVTKADHKEIKVSIDGNVFEIARPEDNLVYKAAAQLGVYGVDIRLTKRIPVQAGLGGGSSDAATTLCLLNEMFELGYSKQELAARAVNLGADVPFFIYGGACIAEGIGEVLTPVEPVTRYNIKIKKPDMGLSTGMIYSLVDKATREGEITLANFLAHFNNDDDELKNYLFNVMEKVSLPLCPDIAEAKKQLIAEGCIAAMMSGSGSAVFGIM